MNSAIQSWEYNPGNTILGIVQFRAVDWQNHEANLKSAIFNNQASIQGGAVGAGAPPCTWQYIVIFGDSTSLLKI